ncbi:hypothetical protein AMTRI_Chr06g192620 [Amborella trichopoda]|uniref:Uncharacterized protein n=1 Tax=Amborella trichopoda TaxID=13333 RepID=W1P8C2_AMBTC|nr:uncharacterized protein PAM68-like [Amborella trichopoda]ERN06137.1 hypothetical protein AMTR_s00016p00088520 [Amborella trichopoda]|eukprot:XP_006844462.1 uncharacterized protein PAM68-like [Amborella trichopoda]
MNNPQALLSPSLQHSLIIYTSTCTRIPRLPHTGSHKHSHRRLTLRVGGRGFGGLSDREREDRETRSSKQEGDDDEIPQVVLDRMLRRIVFYVGAPMGLGLGLLWAFDTLKNGGVWDAPMWLPLLTVLLGFGTSALGVAYGTLSASWDPSEEGSLLGWKEAQKNWPVLWKEEKM